MRISSLYPYHQQSLLFYLYLLRHEASLWAGHLSVVLGLFGTSYSCSPFQTLLPLKIIWFIYANRQRLTPLFQLFSYSYRLLKQSSFLSPEGSESATGFFRWFCLHTLHPKMVQTLSWLCSQPLFLQFMGFCRSLYGVGSRVLRWSMVISLPVRIFTAALRPCFWLRWVQVSPDVSHHLRCYTANVAITLVYGCFFLKRIISRSISRFGFRGSQLCW